MEPRFKILYIIGAGRSGTTLLDIVIGNSPNFFSAGELNRFTKRDGLPHDPRDNDVKTFWQKVNEFLFSKNLKNPRSYYDLFKKFEYHNSFFGINAALKSAYFDNYSHYQQELFTAIHKTVHQDHNEITIIDSSKYPVRGFVLSKIFGDRVSLLYVKRHPSEVVESFQKKDVEQPSKGRLKAHLYLLAVNIIAHKILQRAKHSNGTCTISYDEFVQSPIKTLEKIEDDLNIELTISKEIIKANGAFRVGSLFDGNRLRLEKEIKFRKQSQRADESGHFLNKIFLPLHNLTWYKR